MLNYFFFWHENDQMALNDSGSDLLGNRKLKDSKLFIGAETETFGGAKIPGLNETCC